MIDIIFAILLIFFVIGATYGFIKIVLIPTIKNLFVNAKQTQKIYKDNVAEQFFDQFENEYLLYSKHNTSKFVIQKLMGVEPHYIFRIRESDLKNKNIDNKGYALYTMTRELITLIKNKGYNFVYYDFPDINNAKNPTIIKIAVKI